MTSGFYRDLGVPEAEYLARAAAKALGVNPDSMVRDSGYSTAALIPAWWKYQTDALKFIAMRDAGKFPQPDEHATPSHEEVALALCSACLDESQNRRYFTSPPFFAFEVCARALLDTYDIRKKSGGAA